MDAQLAFWLMFTLGSTFGMGIPFLVWSRRTRTRDLDLQLYDMDDTGANNSGVQTGVMPGNQTVGRVGERSNESLPLVPSNLSVPVLEESMSFPCKGCGIDFRTETDLLEHQSYTRHHKDIDPKDVDNPNLNRVRADQDPMSAVVGQGFARCDVCGDPVTDIQTVGKGTSVSHAYHFQGHMRKNKPPVGVV